MKMTISQVARLAEVGVETVRFYEREVLLDQPARPDTGYRQYALDVVKRIQFIKRAKDLGFSLKEIAELLALREALESTCADVKQRALSKIADVERKVEDPMAALGNHAHGRGGHAVNRLCRQGGAG